LANSGHRFPLFVRRNYNNNLLFWWWIYFHYLFLYMENKISTKALLIGVLVLNLFLNLIGSAINNSPYYSFPKTDHGIIILIIRGLINVYIFVLMSKRMEEVNEKISPIGFFFLLLFCFTLINVPIVNIFAIYSSMKYGKTNEKEKTSELEELGDINYNKPPSEANSGDIKRWLMAGWVILWLIILIKVVTLYI